MKIVNRATIKKSKMSSIIKKLRKTISFSNMIYSMFVVLFSVAFVILTNFSLLFLIKNFVLYRLKIGDISILRTVNDNFKVEMDSFYNSNDSYYEHHVKIYEKHVKIDRTSDEMYLLSKLEFQDQFEKIKDTLIGTFSKLERPITHCSNVPSDLQGRIDILEMLERFNLSLLTDFYGKSDKKYKQLNYSFYFLTRFIEIFSIFLSYRFCSYFY